MPESESAALAGGAWAYLGWSFSGPRVAGSLEEPTAPFRPKRLACRWSRKQPVPSPRDPSVGGVPKNARDRPPDHGPAPPRQGREDSEHCVGAQPHRTLRVDEDERVEIAGRQLRFGQESLAKRRLQRRKVEVSGVVPPENGLDTPAAEPARAIVQDERKGGCRERTLPTAEQRLRALCARRRQPDVRSRRALDHAISPAAGPVVPRRREGVWAWRTEHGATLAPSLRTAKRCFAVEPSGRPKQLTSASGHPGRAYSSTVRAEDS